MFFYFSRPGFSGLGSDKRETWRLWEEEAQLADGHFLMRKTEEENRRKLRDALRQSSPENHMSNDENATSALPQFCDHAEQVALRN